MAPPYVKVGPFTNGAAPVLSKATLDQMETQYTEAVAQAAVLIAAIPEDGAAGVASERTLGVGAVQAAAGDHGHGTQYDDQDSDESTVVDSEAQTVPYENGAAINSGQWTVLLTKTITLAAAGEVHGFAAGVSLPMTNLGGMSLELFIDGVEEADSGDVWVLANNYYFASLMEHRACASGNRTVELKHHNTAGGATQHMHHCYGLFAGASKVL